MGILEFLCDIEPKFATLEKVVHGLGPKNVIYVIQSYANKARNIFLGHLETSHEKHTENMKST